MKDIKVLKTVQDLKYRELVYEKLSQGQKIDINDFAKYMRFYPTLGEWTLFHEYLQKRPENFRRQKILEPYIADFYCGKLKLIIEVNGSSHNERKYYYDINRYSKLLESNNIAVVEEYDVLKNLNGVALFLGDVIKYLSVLYKKKIILNHKNELFDVSPLCFPKGDLLKDFSEEEKKPVDDPFKDFLI